MNTLKLKNCLVAHGEPIADAELYEVENVLGFVLPDELKELLQFADGFLLDTGVHIFSAKELPEINARYSADIYAPEYIVIGGDSGGSAILVKKSINPSSVYIVEHASMQPRDMELISNTISDWINNGAKLNASFDKDSIYHQRVDVILERTPPDTKFLLTIKNELNLELPISSLMKIARVAPAILLKNVPYAGYVKKCEKLNSIFDCLRLSPSGNEIEKCNEMGTEPNCF